MAPWNVRLTAQRTDTEAQARARAQAQAQAHVGVPSDCDHGRRRTAGDEGDGFDGGVLESYMEAQSGVVGRQAGRQASRQAGR